MFRGLLDLVGAYGKRPRRFPTSKLPLTDSYLHFSISRFNMLFQVPMARSKPHRHAVGSRNGFLRIGFKSSWSYFSCIIQVVGCEKGWPVTWKNDMRCRSLQTLRVWMM